CQEGSGQEGRSEEGSGQEGRCQEGSGQEGSQEALTSPTWTAVLPSGGAAVLVPGPSTSAGRSLATYRRPEAIFAVCIPTPNRSATSRSAVVSTSSRSDSSGSRRGRAPESACACADPGPKRGSSS